MYVPDLRSASHSTTPCGFLTLIQLKILDDAGGRKTINFWVDEGSKSLSV